MYHQILCSNSSPILESSVKFASQTCHENINIPLDGAYLSDFGIDITWDSSKLVTRSTKELQYKVAKVLPEQEEEVLYQGF